MNRVGEDSSLSIIHCDLDAFFAAVEQRDDPSLRGKPVIIGGPPESRSVVSTCSYEARVFGVRSAMPVGEARRLCPDGIFLPVNMAKYLEASRRVFAIFDRFTPLVEPLSIDEAFLDVSGCFRLFGSSEDIGRQVKEQVREETGLIISAGISYNKFLAKLATKLGKPDGLKIISREEMLEITAELPVGMIWGVGPKARERFNQMGIYTFRQLREYDANALERAFGSSGRIYHQLARGIDSRTVETEYQQKSIGREMTFHRDLSAYGELLVVLLREASEVGRRLRRANLKAGTVTVKYRHGSFQTVTRRHSLERPSDSDQVIYEAARAILEGLYREGDRIRLLGLYASGLVGDEGLVQADLFGAYGLDQRRQKLDATLDRLNERFGRGSVTRAVFLEPGELYGHDEDDRD